MRVRLTMGLTLRWPSPTGAGRPTTSILAVQAFEVRSDGPLSHPLRGTAHVGGAKNSALKLMAASLLATGCTVVTNVPDILDVHVMARLLEELGCTVEVRHGLSPGSTPAGSGTVAIDVPEHLRFEAPYDLVRRLRAS